MQLIALIFNLKINRVKGFVIEMTEKLEDKKPAEQPTQTTTIASKKTNYIADSVMDSLGNLSKIIKLIGLNLPILGGIGKGVVIAGDAYQSNNAYSMIENFLCSAVSFTAQNLVSSKIVGAAIVKGAAVGASATGPLPNLYLKGFGAVMGGLTSAKAAITVINPVTTPIGELTKNACHTALGWLYNRTPPKKIIKHTTPDDIKQKTPDDKETNWRVQSGAVIVAKERIKRELRYDIPCKSDGFTALHSAAQRGEVDLICCMLDLSTLSINAPLASQKTLLHLAAESGHLGVVTLLIANGAEIDALNAHNETPLMLAIQAGHVNTAKFLAENGRINLVNLRQQTASHLALQYGMHEVIAILRRRGETIPLNDKKNLTSLYFLVQMANTYTSITCTKKVNLGEQTTRALFN